MQKYKNEKDIKEKVINWTSSNSKISSHQKWLGKLNNKKNSYKSTIKKTYDWPMATKRYPSYSPCILRSCYFTHQKEFTDVIILKALKGRDYSELSAWAQSNHKGS